MVAQWVVRPRMIRRLLLVSLLGTILVACNDQSPISCTRILVSINVLIVDAAGQGVTGLESRTVVLRTGQRIYGAPEIELPPGGPVYPVVADTDVDHIRPRGDSLAFVAFDSTRTAAAVFVVDIPDQCHVNKVSGPDTLLAL